MLPHHLITILAITLGLPFLVLLALVSSESGASMAIFTTALAIVVFSAFLMLMVFEIKRLVDLPSDEH